MSPVTKYSLRDIYRARWSWLATAALLVVAVVAVLVFPMRGKSALRTIKRYGFEDGVLVMEKNNLKLAFSRVDEELHQFVRTAPHVKIEADRPLVAPYLQMSSVYGDRFLMLRGITDDFYRVKGKTFRIVEGRDLKDPYDILIGYLLPRRLGKPYKVGDTIRLENRDWKIVGVFEAKRDPVESGALVRIEDFREVSARGTYSYVEIKVDSPKNMPTLMKYVNMAFDALHAEFPDAPAIMALPERQYWSRLANVFKMAVMLGGVRAAVIAICALLTVINISHSSIMKRSGEFRALSAGGVSRQEILSGLLLETAIVSVAAGVIAGLIVMRTSGSAINLQMSTVILNVPRSAFPRAIIAAIGLGLAGVMLPALKLTGRS
jgi:putative ABC transport system permease protein